VFARVEAGSSLGNPPPAGGAIYRYDFASSRFNEILRVPGEAIGRLAIAPDGQTIVFERAAGLDSASDRVVFGPRLLCPCSLWTVATSGGTARQLVADGRAPAWSPAAPSAAPERRVQLPLIAR
jgi:Tol biopolymer transport system component